MAGQAFSGSTMTSATWADAEKARPATAGEILQLWLWWVTTETVGSPDASIVLAMARTLLVAILLSVAPAFAAESEFGLALGRAIETDDTDVLRLTWRNRLRATEAWWTPTHGQLGATLWRVPDIRGSTRRFDLNATALWRKDRSWGYLEAGFGGYLLSKTVNSPEHRLPSAFEFGSHIGAGLRVGPGSIGVAIQHLSNAGLKQPNGGIDLVLIQYAVSDR